MVEFENPYAQADSFARAYSDCLNCGGKLWEYTIQDRTVCEDYRELLDSSKIFDKSIGHE